MLVRRQMPRVCRGVAVLADLRKDYSLAGLREEDLAADPFTQFQIWFEQAQAAKGHEPNAMTVATATADGRPSARTVLLKGLDHGFIFYTNFRSAKGTDLSENPEVELLFYWPELERQVRIHGIAERLDPQDSLAYYQSRPRGSQIGAAISPQSQVIASREIIEEAYARFEAEHAGENLPLPPHWGGYRVVPESIEFWQGRTSRLHDRLRYVLTPDRTWRVERLAP
jgi:pyridoxamine 5'-phosphate oxidase